LRQVLIVPVLAVLLGAAALIWQMHSAAVTVAGIEFDDDRIAQTLLIEQLIVDEETGLRGYQTTGDTRFLLPYREAEEKLPAVLAARRAMIQTDARRAEFAEFEQVHQTWQEAFAEPLIATIEAGGSTNDVDLNLTGKRGMDEMRHRLLQMNALTQTRRANDIKHWRAQVRNMTIALVALAIFIGVVIGVYTRRLLEDVSAAFRESIDALRLRAEQIYRSEQKLRTTLQSIGEGVITCDAEGRVATVNDVASQLTGWTEDEARFRPISQVFHIVNEVTRQPLEDPVTQVTRLNRTVAREQRTTLVRKDGAEISIDDSGAPIRDEAGAMIGVVLVFRDVTMARRSQEALIANEKLAVAGRLAATIAHEIHNPLDSVSNLLFLMDGNSSPEETTQFLQLAKQELARVTQISRAMLSLHRESREPVPVDLKEMLTSLLLLMERRFHDLGVTVQHDLPEGLIVRGFPAELRQVFTNLLGNAAGTFA
jgi:PAS domain S-box-containing protein